MGIAEFALDLMRAAVRFASGPSRARSAVQPSSAVAEATGGLRAADAAIAALLRGNSYIRDSQRVARLQRMQAPLSATASVSWRLRANEQDRAMRKRVRDFAENSKRMTDGANKAFVYKELQRFSAFFDSVENNPLTQAQRSACVINEDNNLVLAGAGTGKTSTMIGRAGYLLASGRAKPDEILMLAYGRKAAEEMQTRQDEKLRAWTKVGTPTIKTFHALGLEIIGKAEGVKPSISPLAEDSLQFMKFIDEQVWACCEDPEYRAKLIRYCGTERFPYRNPFDFASMEEYDKYVRENELRTLRGEIVKSFEEVVVANFLNANSVEYAYERDYEVITAGPDFRQYRPDFYLPGHGIYIEHFALNERGIPPEHFDQQAYIDGVAWKRGLHEENGTRLIETYSHLKRAGLLESHLASKLREAGVQLIPRPESELLAELREASQVSEFAELVAKFIALFKQANLGMAQVRDLAAGVIDSQRLLLLLDLFAPIIDAYEARLRRDGDIDFADMIHRATKHVEERAYDSPYRHILIDEFQDISPERARLVLTLRNQHPQTITFAVGDDWQSIYRFTGSNIAYTRDFQQYFGPTVTTPLETTFRFNEQIAAVSSKFVLKNPGQIRKTITAVKTSPHPEVSLIRAAKSDDGLLIALGGISERVAGQGGGGRASVLVLGRFNFIFDDWRSSSFRRRLRTDYSNLNIDFMTVHAAKGKEADYVVVVGMNRGPYGFPSGKATDKVLELLLPKKEGFRHAEERRLFYVALTRAKVRTYLVYDPTQASSFINELLTDRDPYPVCTDEFSANLMCAEIPFVACPKCGSGGLVLKTGKHGSFVGCNHHPYCDYREKPCPQCGSLMSRDRKNRTCTNPSCGLTIPMCPQCGGMMVERTGRYGRFWGCTNYKKGSAFVCNGTINIESRKR